MTTTESTLLSAYEKHFQEMANLRGGSLRITVERGGKYGVMGYKNSNTTGATCDGLASLHMKCSEILDWMKTL